LIAICAFFQLIARGTTDETSTGSCEIRKKLLSSLCNALLTVFRLPDNEPTRAVLNLRLQKRIASYCDT